MAGVKKAPVFLATALALVAVVAITPTSSWVFKNNLDGLAGKWRYVGANNYPMVSPRDDLMNPSAPRSDEEELVRAYALYNSSDPRVSGLSFLRKRALDRKDDPVAWAHYARMACNFPLDAPPQPWKKPPSGRFAANAEMLLEATDGGKKADPNNALFPILRAYAFTAKGQKHASYREIQLAGKLPKYNEYLADEYAMRTRALESFQGYRGEYLRIMTSASITLPHLAQISQLCKNLNREGSDETRIAVLSFAATMARQTETIMGILVAGNVAASVFSANRIINAKYPKERFLADATALDRRLRQDPADPNSATSAAAYLIKLRKSFESSRQTTVNDEGLATLGWPDVLGTPVIAAMLLLPVFAGCFYLASGVTAKRPHGSFAHSIAGVMYLLIYLGTRIASPVVNAWLLALPLGLFVAAFLYSERSLAEASLWCGVIACLTSIAAVVYFDAGFAGAVPFGVLLVLCAFGLKLDPENYPKYATQAGWLLCFAGLLLLPLDVPAHLPLLSFGLILVLIRATRRLNAWPWVNVIALVVLSLSAGLLVSFVRMGGYEDTGLMAVVIACATIVASILLRMGPTGPRQLAAAGLTLAVLYLGTTGFALYKNKEAGALNKSFMAEAASVRRAASPLQG